MSISELVISSEDQAWELLRKACSQTLDLDPLFEIKFENWPVLEIHLDGRQFNSSLTTKMMEGFIDLQKSLNRAYASFYRNSGKANSLTDQEKDALEIIIKIESGSTGIKAIISDALKEFAKGAANKVNGNQVVIIVLGVALVVAGHSSWKNYLQSQKERDVSKDELATRRFAGDEETKRMQIFADAIKKEPKLQHVKDDAEEVYNNILKGASKARMIKVAGHELKQDEIKSLVRASRETSTEVRLDGEYRIVSFDNSKTGHYVVEVKGTDDKTFTASLNEASIIVRDQNKALIQKALWDRVPLNLMINGKTLRGDITQATIVDVKDRYQ